MTHEGLDYARRMRDEGYRVTPQRELILDAICGSGGHTTPEEIYARVHKKAPALSRATVYRTVEFLCEMRLVVAMRWGAHSYYEIAGAAPHHHLVCRRCDRVQALDSAIVGRLTADVRAAHRFAVDMDHLALFGLCDRCARRAQP